MQVYDSLSGLVGNTPLVRLRSVTRGIPGSVVLAKVEYFNPGGSEERRVGKECHTTCRSRWSPYH